MMILRTIALATALAACTAGGVDGARDGDSAAAAGRNDTIATSPPAADGPMMRTSAETYALRKTSLGYQADIPYTYTNRTDGAVYLVNCNGDVTPGIQRMVGGEFTQWWIPSTNACLSPPVVIAPGSTYSDTVRVVISPQDPQLYASIDTAPAGSYRLVWYSALSSFDDDARGFGQPIPIGHRVSNRFTFRHGTTTDSGLGDADSGGRTMMTTSATEYVVRRTGVGFQVTIPYTYRNRTGAAVHLVNCGGNVSPSVERKVGDRFERWWDPVMPECLSRPIVIAPGAMYTDSLRMEILRQDGAPYTHLSSAPPGTYRLNWTQALSSFDADARPFGPSLPVEQRVSNPFVLRP